MEKTPYIVVYLTCPRDKAAALSQNLVEGKLAACVNIVSTIRSIYTWKGQLCDDEESLLIIKTRAELFEKLRKKVIALHPYEVPEVIALPIIFGHPPYLQWIEASTSPEKTKP